MTDIDIVVTAINAPSSGIVHLARRVRSLADMRGFWSLSDQAILSAGNFLCNWLLLRSQAAWYGNYYIVLSFILFLNNLHMSLVTYPMMITSAGISDSELRRRVRRTLGMTLILLIPESIVMTWGTVAVMGWRLVPWTVSALIFWQLQETVRRALMARLEHRRAIVGDIVSYFGQVALLWVLIACTRLSAQAAFALFGITGGLAFVIQAFQLRLLVPSETPPRNTMLQQMHHHWKLGQWVLLTNIVNVLTCYSVPWTVRYFHGVMGAAMFSAVVLLLNASNPLLISVSNLIAPVVAKIKAESEARGETGLGQAKFAAIKYSLQGALLLLPYFGMLVAMPALVLHLVYKAGSPYMEMTGALRAFTVAYTLMYVSSMLNAFLCGLGKSHMQFYGQVVSGIMTVLITLPLAAKFGVVGAAWGSVFPVIFQVMVGIYFVRQSSVVTPGGFEPIMNQPMLAEPQ